MLSLDAIDAHIAHLQHIGRAETTWRCARNTLIRCDRLLPMGILVALPEEIEALLPAGMPAGTRATYYDTLVRFYRWLARTGRISYDPTEDMSRPAVPRRVPRPARDEHVAAACAGPSPWRLHCRLAAFGGLRCVEVANLDRADITRDDGMLLRGKGGHERVVPTPPEVWEIVVDMPPGLVTRPVPSWVSGATNAYLLQLTGMHVTMHRLRAWYATTALAAGADLRTVQELLGHKSVSTTEVYTYVFDAAKRRAVERMPRLGQLATR